MKRLLAIVGIALVSLVILAYISLQVMNSRTFMFFGELVNRVNTGQKVVALTFDDGPSERTEEILRTLNELGVKATFFINGSSLAERPELGKQIVKDGHELGNHTYSHKRMVFKSPRFIREEIEKTDRLIRQAGYKGDILFRPPNAKKLFLLSYYLYRNNRTTVLWDIEPDSYPEIASSPERIAEYTAANTKPGSIILLHGMYRETSKEAIRPVVQALQEKGFKFVTVSELLNFR